MWAVAVFNAIIFTKVVLFNYNRVSTIRLIVTIAVFVVLVSVIQLLI